MTTGASVDDRNNRQIRLWELVRHDTYRAEGRNFGRGSNRRWMKVQWQVRHVQVAEECSV